MRNNIKHAKIQAGTAKTQNCAYAHFHTSDLLTGSVKEI